MSVIPGAYGSRRQSYATPSGSRRGSTIGSSTARPDVGSRKSTARSVMQDKARERAAQANRQMHEEEVAEKQEIV